MSASVFLRMAVETPLLRAWAVAVAHNQSRNGLGVDWSYAKRVSNMNANSWAKLPSRIELAGRRLRHVRIECKPYQEILKKFNTPRTAVFLDPPYLPSTRVSASRVRRYSRRKRGFSLSSGATKKNMGFLLDPALRFRV